MVRNEVRTEREYLLRFAEAHAELILFRRARRVRELLLADLDERTLDRVADILLGEDES